MRARPPGKPRRLDNITAPRLPVSIIVPNMAGAKKPPAPVPNA